MEALSGVPIWAADSLTGGGGGAVARQAGSDCRGRSCPKGPRVRGRGSAAGPSLLRAGALTVTAIDWGQLDG